MPIFLRKVLKMIVISYASGFLFVAAHMPQSVEIAASNANPQILVAPAYTPAILRAYSQFAFARIWPFVTSAGTVTLGDLINSHGSEQFRGLSTIQFDMTPSVRPGQEGRLTYVLGLENYNSTFYGAFMEITGGDSCGWGNTFA